MKKTFLILFAFCLSFGAFAQDTTSQQDPSQMQSQDMQSKMMKPDGIYMKDGKMILMQNGQRSELTQDMTLTNGTVVSPNGTAKLADGTTQTLKDGDFIDMDGTMGTMKWKSMDDKEKMKIEKSPTDTLR